jgi:hypothetical protein
MEVRIDADKLSDFINQHTKKGRKEIAGEE